MGNLPMVGQVLGIDVGFSDTRRTTCFCLLSWTRESAEFGFRKTTASEHARRSALVSLCGHNENHVLAVAVDGPLAMGLTHVSHYRAAEALLSQGIMQKRGKPGQ